MGKKRRAWWIVGALVVAVALFAVGSFFVDHNSTDARMERAVAQIVEEYGFEPQAKLPDYIGPGLRGKSYSRAPVSAQAEREIVAILREACPSYEYEHRNVGSYNSPAPGEPLTKTHVFFRAGQRRGMPQGVVFYPDNKGYAEPGAVPAADLAVVHIPAATLWQRIKGLWPW